MKDLIGLVLFFGAIVGAYEAFVRFAWYMLCESIKRGEVKEDIFARLEMFNQLPPM